MAEPFYFICYSRRDAADFALTFADQLVAGPPSIKVWLDRRKEIPSIDWDEQIAAALQECAGIFYLMTRDSVSSRSVCKREWTRGLKYKKPIIPLLLHRDAEMPFRLEPREYIDFTGDVASGLARLREFVRWRATPEGILQTLNERLEDARRDLDDPSQDNKARIDEEISQLLPQIEALQATIRNPQAAQARTQENIARGLERERKPEEAATPKPKTHFINRPPMVPPNYFQDRHVETGLVGAFLRNDSSRLMTVVGRGGVGKTAMVCRLLRSLESGTLPDDGGELTVDGIVYLSSRSGHTANFPNLFYDLCKLLPENTARILDEIYRDPTQSVSAQMQSLLREFPRGRIVILLDNFEDVVDTETQSIKERELDEAMRTVLEAPPHALKFIVTTRVAPQALLRVQPGLQDSVELDQGLKSPYAENVLKAMDASGTLGLNLPDAPLAEAREATRGFPRALEAVVGILRTDRSTNLRELLDELRQVGSKAEDVVRDLVGEAYNRLDPLAQEVMQALAVYGAPVPAVAVDYLLQPYRVGIDSSKTLGRLVNMQIVRGEARRFSLHQVDRDYALSRLVEGKRDDRDADPLPYTRYALRHRAAEYFKETRKPRDSWKSLEDIEPHLVEFELRVAGQDYDAAARVLIEIDDYLNRWGHYNLMVDRYELLPGRLINQDLEWLLGQFLGGAYGRIGQLQKSLGCFERSLALAKARENILQQADSLSGLGWITADVGDRAGAIRFNEEALALYVRQGHKEGEGVVRGNLGNQFSVMGRSTEAIDQYEKAIALHKVAGNTGNECTDTYNLADLYAALGANAEAKRLAQDAQRLAESISYRLIESAATTLLGALSLREGHVQEAIEIYDRARATADSACAIQMQMVSRRELAFAYLLAGDLTRAHIVAQEAIKYRYPAAYTTTLVVGGIVALRKGDRAAASDAFDRTLNEAAALLSGAARSYDAAYAKALALAGLALCRDMALAEAAIGAYREARAISAMPGVIRDELRKLDLLSVGDASGVLRQVRAAASES